MTQISSYLDRRVNKFQEVLEIPNMTLKRPKDLLEIKTLLVGGMLCNHSNLINSVHRQSSFRDKPPNATNILRDKRTKDKCTKGTSLK